MDNSEAAEAKPVFLVEDNAALRKMLTAFFNKAGYEVVAVESGPEALRVFAPLRFALLLADVNLGDGMNGVEVARKLREQEPELKVFMMSGEPASLSLAKAAGVGTCLAKPLNLAQLPRLLGLKAQTPLRRAGPASGVCDPGR